MEGTTTTEKTVQCNVRVPRSLKAALRRRARREKVRTGVIVTEALRSYLDAPGASDVAKSA